MARIYTHYSNDTVDYYLALDSMTSVGYFPLTVMVWNDHKVTLWDDISEVTMEISKLLHENAGMGVEDLIKVMEDIKAFFDDATLEVWRDVEDGALPYVLRWEDDEEYDFDDA